MKLVVVKWLDSARHSGWCSLQHNLSPVTCCSAGIVVDETETALTVATSYTSGDVCDYMTIPKVAILDIKQLKVAHK